MPPASNSGKLETVIHVCISNIDCRSKKNNIISHYFSAKDHETKQYPCHSYQNQISVQTPFSEIYYKYVHFEMSDIPGSVSRCLRVHPSPYIFIHMVEFMLWMELRLTCREQIYFYLACNL